MAFLKIDPDKCNNDNICIEVCPVKILHVSKETGLPDVMDGAEPFCIACGHCVAVCPTSALSHPRMSPDDCPPVRPELIPDPEKAEYFLRYRRSIRVYKDKPVEKDIIGELIRIASHAPSGHNTQPVRWIVVYEKEEVKRLSGMVVDWMKDLLEKAPGYAKQLHMDLVAAAWDAGIDTVCRDAPHLVLACGAKGDKVAETACTIAMTYLDLAAPSFGLGSCFAGFFSAAAALWPPLQDALALPDNNICYSAVMLGYPRYRYKRMCARNKPRIEWR